MEGCTWLGGQERQKEALAGCMRRIVDRQPGGARVNGLAGGEGRTGAGRRGGTARLSLAGGPGPGRESGKSGGGVSAPGDRATDGLYAWRPPARVPVLLNGPLADHARWVQRLHPAQAWPDRLRDGAIPFRAKCELATGAGRALRHRSHRPLPRCPLDGDARCPVAGRRPGAGGDFWR